MSALEDLQTENARLAARVAALEAELAAKPVMDRLTLFRMANSAPWGILTIGPERRIDYAGPLMGPWMRRPPPAFGEPLAEALIPELLEQVRPAIDGALAGQSEERTFRLRNGAGDERELRVTVVPRGDPPTGAVVSLYDLTESNAVARAIRENEARLAHITAVNPSAAYIFDVQSWCPVWAAGRTDEVYGHSPEALLAGGGELAAALIHPDDLPKVALRLKKLAARPEGHIEELELRIRRDEGGYRWILDRAVVFERSPDGRIAKTLCAAIDIDERKREEDRRKLLVNELNHRVKNTLAAVQSIARQTLRPGQSPEQAREEFTARLLALSAAHDVLTRENWEGAPLNEIVAGALVPFSIGEGRVSARGPNVRLPARAALGLVMALHELATNAVKHGALSTESGAVAVTWTVNERDDGPVLELEWRESGGPAVAGMTRRGFGTRLLTQGLPAELDATTDLAFDAGGVVCRIGAPLRRDGVAPPDGTPS